MNRSRQSTLNKYYPSLSHEDSDQSSGYAPTPRKSTLAETFFWTRVKSRQMMQKPRINVFDVASDLEWDKNLKAIRKGTVKDLGEILFDPDAYNRSDDTLLLQNNQLSDVQLLEYAKIATILREQFKDKAKISSRGQDA